MGAECSTYFFIEYKAVSDLLGEENKDAHALFLPWGLHSNAQARRAVLSLRVWGSSVCGLQISLKGQIFFVKNFAIW